jgi:hypothetical protein
MDRRSASGEQTDRHTQPPLHSQPTGWGGADAVGRLGREEGTRGVHEHTHKGHTNTGNAQESSCELMYLYAFLRPNTRVSGSAAAPVTIEAESPRCEKPPARIAVTG